MSSPVCIILHFVLYFTIKIIKFTMAFKEGDWILLVWKDKKYLKQLSKGFNLSVKGSTLKLEDILNREKGEHINGFYLFSPTLEDILLLGFKRKTQILYPKDSFYVAFKLDIKDKKVLEFGTGSGTMTAVLSQLAQEVWTFEVVKEFYENAIKNWNRFNLCSNVRAFNKDFIEEDTLEEEYFDACFVDVREPWLYLDKLHTRLKKGAPCCFLLPTTNQVSMLLKALEKGFGNVEVLEILHRHYKVNPDRLRPEDRMVAHTGYLVFCRKTT